MLATTRLTVIVKAREACHLNAHIVTRYRLHADNTALWHGLRISTFLRAWGIASERPFVRELNLLLTITTQPLLHRFLIQIIEPGTATRHARVLVEGLILLQDRCVSKLRARPADTLHFTVIFITLGHMPVRFPLRNVVVCSSGRLNLVIRQECVNVNFGLFERNHFIFILSNIDFFLGLLPLLYME